MFWKKQINSEEYEKLNKKSTDLGVSIDKIRADLDRFETNLNSLRGLVNKKLGYVEQKPQDQQQPQALNNNDEFRPVV
jgi:hypothetical protein